MKFLADFFPVLLFFIAYKFYGIYVATAVAISASIIQVGFQWFKHRKLQTMHLVTLGLLVFFGGLTLLLQDRAFIMWKPSIVNWLFATVFIGSQFIGEKCLVERMMSQSIDVPKAIWIRVNIAWAIFFTAMGGLNLYVASRFFKVESALEAATGQENIDFDQCSTLFQSAQLDLCLNAQALESSWVNFKLFGMMGLTFAFILLQAFYLARFMHEPDEQDKED